MGGFGVVRIVGGVCKVVFKVFDVVFDCSIVNLGLSDILF